MSFNDDYLKLRKKRLEEQQKKQKNAPFVFESGPYQNATLTADDIAPVKNQNTVVIDDARDIGKKNTGSGLFKAGTFADGYQFGDITKAKLGTVADVVLGIVQGVAGIGEGLGDLAMYGVAGVQDLVGNDDDAERLRKATQEDIIAPLFDSLRKKTNIDDTSLLGDFGYGIAQGVGQVGAIIATGGAGSAAGLGTVGTSALTTGMIGASSMGSGMSEAYKSGATDEEALAYGAMSGVIDAGTEMIFGGLGKSVKAIGVSKGISSLDDVFAKKISSKISSQFFQNAAEYGIKAGAEGFEEFLAGLGSAAAKKLTYMSEEELSQLVEDENLLEQFVAGTIVSGIVQSGDLVKSTKQGRDFITNFSANEETVIEKVYNDRVAEAEQDGTKLTNKEKNKLYEQVQEDMRKGYISTDDIESVLGGETYKSYKDTIDSEDAILKEFDELGKKQNATLAEQSRYAELQAQVKEIKSNSNRNNLKSQLSEEVYNSVKEKDFYLAESYNERARRGTSFEADLSQYDDKTAEVVKRAIDSGILNNTRRTHEFVDMVAKISADKGVLFDFTNNEKLKESGFAVDGASINGYVTKDGITVNINSSKAQNSIVGHEITHVLEGTDFYTELQTAIFEYAKSKKDYEGRRKSLEELYKNVEDADIDAELTADLVGDYLFTDADFINNLSTKHRNVFQKIYDEIKYLLKIATKGSKEARELEKVKRAFDKAYRANGNTNEGTKYSLSDSDGKQLTKEQSEYFKDSKMRDENGNLKVMYHGSQDAGFHVFDANMSDDDTSFFFVDRNDVAASYSGTTETYEAQTIRTADDMNNFIESIGVEGYEVVEKDGKFTLLYEGDRIADSNTAKGIYEEFCWYEGVGEGDANYKVYLNLTNPLEVDAGGRNWNNISREFSQEVYGRYKSLTAEEKAALSNLAEWGEYSIFRDEMLEARATAEQGGSGVFDEAYTKNLARAYAKLGGANANLYDAFSIAQENFSEESLKEFAVKQMNTRDYARKAKTEGYDGVIFKNIHDNGGYSNGSEGASTVAIAFESNQIKSVANEKPTSNPDIRFSLSEAAEETKDLIAVHNLTEEKLAKSLALGGLPMPSIAIARAIDGHSNFGNISLVFNKETIDPQFMRSNKVYSGLADPFKDRDIKAVGNRQVKAYMYENPEVKPFFQEEANRLLKELRDGTKGERWFNDQLYYDSGGEYGFSGTKRHVSADIAYLLDNLNFSYADIEKGINAIIEDNGKENNAASKRIEFILNDRLLKGYTDFTFGYDVPPNQDYINLLNEKQIIEYSDEARAKFFEVADEYAPPMEDIAPIAPIAENTAQEPKIDKPIEDIAPTFDTKKKGEIEGQQTMFEEVETESEPPEVETESEPPKVAEILTEEPLTPKKKNRAFTQARANLLDKGSVFEDLSLKTGNRELQGKYNFMHYSEARAQKYIFDNLKPLVEKAEQSGKSEQLYEYVYHLHNIDRMSLETEENRVKREALREKFKGYSDKQIERIAMEWIKHDTPKDVVERIKAAREYVEASKGKNKPVFGDTVTADVSRDVVKRLEAENPEFKELSKEIIEYNAHLRQMLVDAGVISQETADLWAKMYPHYVPIRRLGDEGLSVNVPLDTNKTGVNAPIKRATGGNRDIMPLFDTMAMRTEQTFKAIAKNNFGTELMHTLDSTVESNATSLDDVIDSFDNHEELLQEGKNGKNPTFTVFENGKRVTFEITEDMYDALKPTSKGLSYTNKVANTASNIFRGILTEYNPVFMVSNAAKDIQDVLINSQHAAKTYANIPKAIKELTTKGKWHAEYMANGGEQNTYFDSESKTFKEENKGFIKTIGMPLRAISTANNFIERIPRLAEYIASREAGASVEVAMLDAARVTTNFAAGGDVTKFLNRNGATFLNASVQGFNQNVRNVREAKANGLKGWVKLTAKVALAGVPALLLNNLLWDDDEEYEELSEYVKDKYYIVAKTEDGKFIRIPKGRVAAVIQDAFEQINNAVTGNDEVDFKNFFNLVISNLAPNNPIENNILAPIIQVANNKTWYGEDLVPTRLQDLPAGEQYDESTDAFSKWLGEKTNISPYKLNYLLNQYSGGVGDVFLPMLTPEAESGDNSFKGNILAPMKDKFTTDSTLNNKNVSAFYDTMDELTTNAKSSKATDEDILKYKYFNSINAELSELYAQKREIQNSDLANDEKYEAVRELQEQINDLARESLNTYENVYISDGYASIGDIHYRWYEPGEDSDAEAGWQKITDKQLEKQEAVTSYLGVEPSEYWKNKTEYDFAYEYPEKYSVAKSVGGYSAYKRYTSELYDIKADKDEDGKSISGSRKEKVIEYVNNLDIDYGARLILFKSEYNADDTYNYDIIDYLNNRQDISYEDMETILKELGFTVLSDGTIQWD